MPGTFDAVSTPGEYGEKKKRTPIGHVADTFQFGKTGLAGYDAASGSYYGASTYGSPMQGDSGSGRLGGGTQEQDPARWGYGTPSTTPSPYVETPVSFPVGSPGGDNGGGGGGVGGNMPTSALTQVIREARGPAVGWNDRPAVGQNIESLGVRTPPMAFEGLSNVARRFGRVY